MGNRRSGTSTSARAPSCARTSRASTTRWPTGRWRENAVLRDAFTGAERVHLIGLVSEGGVHSGFGHLEALIELGAALGVEDLVVHAFTDGRDTLPTSGAAYLETLEGWCARAGDARIGSVVGRYFAMDRDSRWDRIQQAYDMLVHGRAPHRAATASEAARAVVRARRDRRVHRADPGRRGGDDPAGPRQRVRLQLPARSDAPDHPRAGRAGLHRGRSRRRRRRGALRDDDRVRGGLALPGRLPAGAPARSRSPACSPSAGLPQLHVAETEKYAHVTYFFNGGEEDPYAGETRELVPSPRDVPTYDHRPEMSAAGVAEAFARHWREEAPGVRGSSTSPTPTWSATPA